VRLVYISLRLTRTRFMQKCVKKGKKNKTSYLYNKTRLLKLDSANLKNQIVGLKNVIERLGNGEKSESEVD